MRQHWNLRRYPFIWDHPVILYERVTLWFDAQSHQPSKRSKLHIEFVRIYPQIARKPGHLFGGAHQGEADAFLLVLGELVRFHAPDRLQLQETSQELDQGEEEFCEIVLNPFRIE